MKFKESKPFSLKFGRAKENESKNVAKPQSPIPRRQLRSKWNQEREVIQKVEQEYIEATVREKLNNIFHQLE